MHSLRTITSLVVAAAIIAIAGCDLAQEPAPTSFSAFGSVHAALGSADLQSGPESVVVDLSGPAAAGGVAVELGQSERLNVFFEPIEMPVDSYFETAVVGVVNGREEVLGRIMHRQTGTRTTTIGADFAELTKYTSSDRLTVSTYVDGIETFSTTLSVDSTDTIGFVNSGESNWATSYHWVYVNGAWSLMIDPAPSETFTLANRPGIQIPFNYLVFTIDGVDDVTRPSTMEFVGEGLQAFTIVGEDTRKLIF